MRPKASFGVEDVAKFEELRGVAGQLSAGDASIAAHARSLDRLARAPRLLRSLRCVDHGSRSGRLETGVASSARPNTSRAPIRSRSPSSDAAIAVCSGAVPGWPKHDVLGTRGLHRARRDDSKKRFGGRFTKRAASSVGERLVHQVAAVAVSVVADDRLRGPTAETEDVTIDHAELEDVRWFDLAQRFASALDGQSRAICSYRRRSRSPITWSARGRKAAPSRLQSLRSLSRSLFRTGPSALPIRTFRARCRSRR